jgi:hypothetical protein
MRTWLIASLTVISFAASGANAATLAPTGSYRTTITGKPAPLNGKWQITFLPGSALRVARNGKVVVAGTAVFANGRMTVKDRSGSYACGPGERKGSYTYRLAARRLTFKALSDKCVGRKLFLTANPFVR